MRDFRLRSSFYLDFIRRKPCLHCGAPAEAHHIQYAQPRAMSLKTGDQFAVPLCRSCHTGRNGLHVEGMPERTWWALRGIDPVKWATQTYEKWNREHGWRLAPQPQHYSTPNDWSEDTNEQPTDRLQSKDGHNG